MVSDHTQHYLHTVRSALTMVVYPLQFVANLPLYLVNWADEMLSTRTHLQERNRELENENLQLRLIQQRLTYLDSENQRLRDLLSSSKNIQDKVLIAELVAIDLDPFKQQVLINKGSHHNVYQGQAVLDAHAVMGQVTHVSPLTATVLRITDPSHSLPIRVNRNGLIAIARGTGSIKQLEVPHLPNNADIRPGDQLVTSGLGGVFPSGYPVAVVTSVTRNPAKPFATILARPSADLDQTREVLLVWRQPEEEDSSPNEGGPKTP